MLVLKPQEAISLSKTHFNEIFEHSFHYRKQLIQRYRDVDLPADMVSVFQEFILENVGVNITPLQVRELFDGFPYEKAFMIDSGIGTLMDTDVRDVMLDVVSQFFMHCDHPRFKDQVDPIEFHDALCVVAAKLGYLIQSKQVEHHYGRI